MYVHSWKCARNMIDRLIPKGKIEIVNLEMFKILLTTAFISVKVWNCKTLKDFKNHMHVQTAVMCTLCNYTFSVLFCWRNERNMLGHIRKVICSTSLSVICIISFKWQNNIWVYFYINHSENDLFIISTKLYDRMMKSSKISADGRDVHVLLTNVMWKNV